MRFSANLGFLWNELPFLERIRAARTAGFDAVECHWPYDTPAVETRSTLLENGFEMLGLNTRRGNVDAGDNGLAALKDREDEAREVIDEALTYARDTGTRAVHVLAGKARGAQARSAFVANLDYACRRAAPDGIFILIEPLNHTSAPGYFLNGTGLAADIIREVGLPNLKLLFDCYHVQILEGDVTRKFETLLPLIGHVQIAAVPDRGSPDHGELDYGFILSRFAALGWDRPIGAEYLTGGQAPDTSWLTKFR